MGRAAALGLCPSLGTQLGAADLTPGRGGRWPARVQGSLTVDTAPLAWGPARHCPNPSCLPLRALRFSDWPQSFPKDKERKEFLRPGGQGMSQH